VVIQLTNVEILIAAVGSPPCPFSVRTPSHKSTHKGAGS
jgi:hypothetical protein